eukprot:CAMPEP_0206420378 /NCGR_PEP_ID=MMETSP0324_2-20121206/801_1 /ASSEMBLY_ACC=CAM_ASM_000836 /TAXON_ID=2866 /ORGANISM="Crypthecodinium cohnii, Strain Seligo" /LENGTH=47 /DNA_ID= /DNA_START= /DNA_END= /DNA_ORIENTATION=
MTVMTLELVEAGRGTRDSGETTAQRHSLREVTNNMSSIADGDHSCGP